MKVLFASYNDYSNLCQGFSDALNSIGIESSNAALSPHAFGYNTQVLSRNQMRNAMRDVDCIIIGHTHEMILDLCAGLGKRLFVIHTGTIYRQNPEKFNAIFNPVVERVLIDSPEFFDKGGKNVGYIAAAMDMNNITSVFSIARNPVFAHYPSNPVVKGTETIKKMMSCFNAAFLCDSEQIVSHEINLKRISECDVYIELFSPMQDGKPYGSFGVTSFEAAALGKIVVTNSTHHHVYKDAYGTNGELVIANTHQEFFNEIYKIINSDIAEKQRATRQWVEECHSLEATGRYLARLLG